MSSRPWNFSGGASSDLASSCQPVTARESSPRRDLKAVPSTPIRSPRSSETRRSNDSSPSASLRACNWMRPERSTRSRKAAPPWPRRAASRPATRYAWWVAWPGSRLPCAAWIVSTGTTPSNWCGNGSMPSARRRSSLARRSSWPSDMGRDSKSGFDLGDLELPRGTTRNRHGDDIAALATDQGLADGRLVGELVVRGIGLRGADDHVLDRLVGLLVLHVDRRPDRDRLGGHRLRVDDRGRAQLLLELGDLLLEHGLLVLRVVVLGVLADVAELARLLDALRHLAAARPGEVLDLRLELFESLR